MDLSKPLREVHLASFSMSHAASDASYISLILVYARKSSDTPFSALSSCCHARTSYTMLFKYLLSIFKILWNTGVHCIYLYGQSDGFEGHKNPLNGLCTEYLAWMTSNQRRMPWTCMVSFYAQSKRFSCSWRQVMLCIISFPSNRIENKI